MNRPVVYRRRPSRTIILFVLLLTVVSARYGYGLFQEPAEGTAAVLLQEEEYQVIRVVDGDTIIVWKPSRGNKKPTKKTQTRVRLLGIDTPETVKRNHPVEPWGKEATVFTKKFLAGGKVRLQLDHRRVDKYGRMLAYVYVEDVMLNEQLILAGLARKSVFRGDSASMAKIFTKAQRKAKEAKRGIWSGKIPAAEDS